MYVEPKILVEQEVALVPPPLVLPDMEANVIAPLYTVYDDEDMSTIYDGLLVEILLADDIAWDVGGDKVKIADTHTFDPWIKIVDSANNIAYKIPDTELTIAANKITIKTELTSKEAMIIDPITGEWVDAEDIYTFAGSSPAARLADEDNPLTADTVTDATDELADADQDFPTLGVKVGDILHLEDLDTGEKFWITCAIIKVEDGKLTCDDIPVAITGYTLDYYVTTQVSPAISGLASEATPLTADTVDDTTDELEHSDMDFPKLGVTVGDTVYLEQITAGWANRAIVTKVEDEKITCDDIPDPLADPYTKNYYIVYNSKVLRLNSTYVTVDKMKTDMNFAPLKDDKIILTYADTSTNEFTIDVVNGIDDQITFLSEIPIEKIIISFLYIHIIAGDIFATARCYERTKMNRVFEIANSTALITKLGPAHIANPLTLAVSMALQNSEGRPIYAIPVDITDAIGWQKAADGMYNEKKVYAIGAVADKYTNPQDEDVKGILQNHINAKSDPEEGSERRVYLWHELLDWKEKIMGDSTTPLTADTVDKDNDFITDADGNFIINGVKINDYLYLDEDTLGYVKCPIFSVEADKLWAVIPDGTYTSKDYYIERENDELALSEEAKAYGAAILDRRVTYVVAPVAKISYGGKSYNMTGAYFTASGVSHITANNPGAPLSKLLHNGIEDIAGLSTFRRKEHLNLMASGGATIIEPTAAGPQTRHLLTTNMTSVKVREIGPGVAWDNAARMYRDVLNPYVARHNITDPFLDFCRLIATGINNYLVNVKKTLRKISLVDLYQGVPSKGEAEDSVYITLDVTSLFPANNFRIKLRV